MLRRYFKQRKCEHEFITVTNLHGDIVNNYSTSNIIARSVVRCNKCDKVEVRSKLDPDCEVVNFTSRKCKGCEK